MLMAVLNVNVNGSAFHKLQLFSVKVLPPSVTLLKEEQIKLKEEYLAPGIFLYWIYCLYVPAHISL